MGWFDRSRRWPLAGQMAMAAAVVLGAAALSGIVVRVGDGREPSVTGLAGQPDTTRDGEGVPAGVPLSVAASDLAVNGLADRGGERSPGAAGTAGGGERSARAVLDTIPVQLEHRGGYDRDLFPTWADVGGGCTARDAVLVEESVTPVDRRGACTILSGTWRSAYDGETVTDPALVEVDHVVALKEAWDSGAWAWTVERRIAYANDLSDGRTLVAVSEVSNQAKSDKDPSNWLPRAEDTCRYVADWVAIKARWSLAMDQSEWGRVKNLLEGPCAGTLLAGWPPAP